MPLVIATFRLVTGESNILEIQRACDALRIELGSSQFQEAALRTECERLPALLARVGHLAGSGAVAEDRLRLNEELRQQISSLGDLEVEAGRVDERVAELETSEAGFRGKCEGLEELKVRAEQDAERVHMQLQSAEQRLMDAEIKCVLAPIRVSGRTADPVHPYFRLQLAISRCEVRKPRRSVIMAGFVDRIPPDVGTAPLGFGCVYPGPDR